MSIKGKGFINKGVEEVFLTGRSRGFLNRAVALYWGGIS
jgi:hypothetical protein